ncbi:hypothetical protein IMSAGC009_01875 [Lachnospiraceae bacterium]|nr:hypothetical protein IMSAGC009_01875 [Lachnospiraceae bacterium]
MQKVLNAAELKQLHKIELEMLIEIDRICKKNKIKYTLIGGSLLGAVRHKGFIPWDDDADVAMLREEYDHFVEACEADLDKSRFYFQDMNATEGYRWGYGKLRRKNTVFMREGQEHMPYEQGVFVDIFPGDAVPDKILLRKLHKFHCFCIRKIMWSEVGKNTDKSIIMRILYKCLSTIPEKTIKQHINSFIRRCNKRNNDLVRTYLFPTRKGVYGYQREWYNNTEDILFEGISLQGSIYRAEYLKRKFGDNYMELPPAEKRQCHPVSQFKV